MSLLCHTCRKEQVAPGCVASFILLRWPMEFRKICAHIRYSPVLYLPHAPDMHAVVVSTSTLDIHRLVSEWFFRISMVTTVPI